MAPRRTVTAEDFQLMIDSIKDAEVIMLDGEGTILTWHDGAQRIKGYAAEEVIGQPVTIFYTDDDVRAHRAQTEMDEAVRTGRYEGEGWRVRKGGERFWANVSMQPMYARGTGELTGYVKITRDVTVQREQERLLRRQRDEILELSTPVIQVWDRVLALPIIGTLDSQRAARLTEGLLTAIAELEATTVIIDISGVPTIDTVVAQHLLRTVSGARLMGAESILSGVRPETAQAMVHLGIDIGRIKSRSTLRDALQLAIKMQRQLSEPLRAALDEDSV